MPNKHIMLQIKMIFVFLIDRIQKVHNYIFLLFFLNHQLFYYLLLLKKDYKFDIAITALCKHISANQAEKELRELGLKVSTFCSISKRMFLLAALM